jgi:exopolysaccharide biosynthesis WecB/TagA/CpsF family protein
MLTLAEPVASDLRKVGPLEVRACTLQAARRDIVNAVLSKTPLRVAFANTHLLYCAVRDPGFADTLKQFYVVNDGIGLTLMTQLTCGQSYPDNLNGTDFTQRVLAALPWGVKVQLVGARPEVVARCAARMTHRWPHIDLCGYRDGFDGAEHALDDIARLEPDLVLVAMGNPYQEQWIARAAEICPRAVFMGVGALFDFIAGAAPRAPEHVRRLRLEWAYRLMHEPRRLWRRYTIEVLVVLAALMGAPRSRMG